MKISESIEKYLIASNIREESSKPKKFYVSDMGKCQRIRFLKRKGIKTEMTTYVYWIFAMGNMIHDFGYKALEAQGLLLASEETLEIEHFVGRFDGKVKNDLGTRSVFDFKSAGKFAIKKAMAGADNDENIAQILTYVMLGRKTDKELSDSGIIVYINKEPGDLIPQIAFDREYHLTSIREKQLTTEMDIMINFWLENKIPPCTCPGWMKNYNSYLPFCLMTGKDIEKYLKKINNSKNQKIISTKQSIIEITVDSDGKEEREEVFHL